VGSGPEAGPGGVHARHGAAAALPVTVAEAHGGARRPAAASTPAASGVATAATAATVAAPGNPCKGAAGGATTSAFVAYHPRACRASTPLGRAGGRVPALVPWRPREGAAAAAAAAAVAVARRTTGLPAGGARAALRDLAAALGLD